MSRPKKATDESLRKIVKFRVTDAEFDDLARQGNAAGLSPHECARLRATSAADRRSRGVQPAAAATTLDLFPPELRQELRRVGVNVNQIARRLNMSGEHYPDELRSASHDLHEILRRMLAALPFR